ncbi:hypothetical protein [Haloarcula japonica]|uniref:Peptidase M48 Ste24p n=1 Tax=Haloarcula japonica (strain ATCC 49778 / DSM 6131 / JCM 7785 / NBRC 101032 / NCIMB 13157 / TR-1) TaxID=1227453 RepID=M0L7X0_HALJT|nr:hypothetical protein [Haloarcula japonica]EMA29712.1 peptidase M48 Ste24p [Haloarcula japonica DSM 6131]
MLFVGSVSLPVAVATVIVVNVVTLLVSPWLNDLIYGWLYGVKWVSPEPFRRRSPTSMDVPPTSAEVPAMSATYACGPR